MAQPPGVSGRGNCGPGASDSSDEEQPEWPKSWWWWNETASSVSWHASIEPCARQCSPSSVCNRWVVVHDEVLVECVVAANSNKWRPPLQGRYQNSRVIICSQSSQYDRGARGS
jgi:hypothetical protein